MDGGEDERDRRWMSREGRVPHVLSDLFCFEMCDESYLLTQTSNGSTERAQSNHFVGTWR